jgi:hypothetical protein
MTATDGAFAQWLSQARIAEDRLTAEQGGLLQAVYAFRQRCGDDYYSSRLLSHFLLHCDCKLKVAQIARLVGISRPTASHQQGVSSKEAIQAAHHRMAGRPHGKLLPRYAGPIAEFILTHADASRGRDSPPAYIVVAKPNLRSHSKRCVNSVQSFLFPRDSVLLVLVPVTVRMYHP